MKPALLPATHYAAGWTNAVLPLEQTNQLGHAYALMEDGPEKRAKFLEIIQAFHGYLMKYLTMIRHGHLPVDFDALKKGKVINADTKQFIQYFMPKGSKMTKGTVLDVCRTFHLCFKGMEADEIYDILMEQLLKAANKYDPLYSAKVGRIVEVLCGKDVLGAFAIDELNKYLDFDGTRFVRVLCRHGFLEPVPDDGGGRLYQRKESAWPPPAKYLNAGPIGFTYYLQTWFRYYLQQHIEHARGQIETKEGVYSIDFGRDDDDGGLDGDMFDARGSLVECSGAWWDEVTDSERQDLDLSQMNLAWVAHTEDPLFADFSRADRMLLYLVFTR